MRFTFGTLILALSTYLLQACANAPLTPPKSATAETDMQRYHALAQQIILDPDQAHKRAKALDVQDNILWAKQSNDAKERQVYLQQAYETLQSISN